ncbi:hypothetical protein PRIO_0882 [Paenibacillus riograndensis SBR5]|uniref:Uncharacterized protein n=1 Tax=Paenibacillus riograndensis SBR5 TaxID=1073571 RepID=A0A0E4H867_9BACL|nr:hypothetical protein PRIO_0882 [Paenibacillus riograndensis SBR5]
MQLILLSQKTGNISQITISLDSGRMTGLRLIILPNWLRKMAVLNDGPRLFSISPTYFTQSILKILAEINMNWYIGWIRI